jgi:hypothetical protein
MQSIHKYVLGMFLITALGAPQQSSASGADFPLISDDQGYVNPYGPKSYKVDHTFPKNKNENINIAGEFKFQLPYYTFALSLQYQKIITRTD